MSASPQHRLTEAALADLLAGARQGNQQALGRLLDQYRPYLLQVAFEELDSELRVKESPSDLVQKSFLEAAHAFAGFHGDSPAVLRAWLRQMLLNNLNDLRARYRTEKRALDREKGHGEELLGATVSAEPSPSEAAVRDEQAVALIRAVDKLSADARTLIMLRHRDDCSFAEIAQQLSITEEAARKRWARAVEELRELVRNLRGSSYGGAL